MPFWVSTTQYNVRNEGGLVLLCWRLKSFDPLTINVFAKLSARSKLGGLLLEEDLASCDLHEAGLS